MEEVKPADLGINSLACRPKTAHKFGPEIFVFSRKEALSLKDSLDETRFLYLFLY